MRRSLLVFAIVMAVGVGVSAFAQQSTKFLFHNGQGMTGWEEFTLRQTDAGYEIDGQTVMHKKVEPDETEQKGKQQSVKPKDVEQTAKHHTVLNKDWTLATYHSETPTPSGPVIFDVSTTENGVNMKVTYGAGQVREAGVAHTPKSFLLENFVPSHMYAALKGNAGGGKFDAIVPTGLTHFAATLTKVGAGEGMLAGKSLKLIKYTLTGGGPEIQVWTDETSGDLMRVAVPSVDVEYVRDGFKMTGEDVAAKASPPAGVVEQQVEFMSAGLKFPATLTMPAKPAGKVTVVVLVHGSGPNDRDETIGPNKPFRDLAWGLAQQGVGSLRYDKRAFLYPTKAGLSLDSQVIADAAAALQFAATLKGVDPKRVFLLGHSLGASLAPYIVERVPAKGVIMMASPARGLNEVIKDQVREILKSQGKSDEEIAKAVAEQDKIGQDVLAGKATEADMRGQIPLPLFKDMLSRDPARELEKVNVPVLVLQGSKDAHVFQADFDLLKEIAAKKPNSEAKMFPNLSHLFMPVESAADVNDAFKAGHVAPEVIETISAWVKKIQ
jgi:dienelactone hydrolase